MKYWTVEPPSGQVLICTPDEDVAKLVAQAFNMTSEVYYNVDHYPVCQCGREF